MEKLIAMVICTILVVALVGCSTSKDGNYPATIMVNATMRLLLKWMIVLFNTQLPMRRMVFLKRMEKQILIKIPERHTQFLKMVW